VSDYLSDDEVSDYKLSSGTYSSDDDEKQGPPVRVTKSFHEHLEQQLGLLNLEDQQFLLAKQLIGSIDEDGYLRRDLIAVIDDLAFSQNIITTEAELEELLTYIKAFDPPGVGARDLQECLLLQLEATEDNPITRMAKRILTEYFDEFSKKHYDKLTKNLDLSDDDLKLVIEEIIKLNPKPGSAFTDSAEKSIQYITPDFIITNEAGELVLKLNARNAPELRVSDSYKEMFRAYDVSKKKDKAQKEAVMFIKQKMDSAKWFIDAIKQRQHTLLSTMQAIMEYQYDHFLSGDDMELKPMILKDIAEVTGLDISTVSRVANSKYVQTEFGTLPLKSFFSESLQTDSGEEVSTREVKKILSEFIDAEDKKKPLSDQKLMEMLNEKGYNIARRTVAKYREQLNLPVARLRKEL